MAEANLVCAQFQAGHTVPWLFDEVSNYFSNLNANIVGVDDTPLFLETGAAYLCPQMTAAITAQKQANDGYLFSSGNPPTS
jgi:hypothetical protein